MARSERTWPRRLVKRALVMVIAVGALAAYGLASAGTQSLVFRPAASSSSTTGGHSVSEAMSPANGSINVAAQGPSHTLYFYWELRGVSGYTGVWNGPLGIGAPGSTFSAPSIVAQGNGGSGSPGYGNFDIAVEGPSHSGDLYWDIAGTWYGPYQFAGPGMVYSSPAMQEDSDGNLQITAQGPSNTLYAYWNTSGAFYGPLGISGPNTTFSGPSMARSGTTVHADVVGPNHELDDYTVVSGSSPRPWSSALIVSSAGTAFDTPFATYSLILFAGPNSELYQASNSSSEKFNQLRGAGVAFSSPSAVVGGDDLAVEGPSNTLDWYFTDVNTDVLDGPLQLGGAGSAWSAPSLLSDQDGNFDIAVQGPSHSLDVYFVIGGVPHGPLQIGAPGSTFASPN